MGGVKKSYIRKLPLVMYKIDRMGGKQKIVTISITMIMCMLWVRQKHFLAPLPVLSILYITSGNFLIYDCLTPPFPLLSILYTWISFTSNTHPDQI